MNDHELKYVSPYTWPYEYRCSCGLWGTGTRLGHSDHVADVRLGIKQATNSLSDLAQRMSESMRRAEGAMSALRARYSPSAAFRAAAEEGFRDAAIRAQRGGIQFTTRDPNGVETARYVWTPEEPANVTITNNTFESFGASTPPSDGGVVGWDYAMPGLQIRDNWIDEVFREEE
jgi:hypothetical protein